MRQLAFSFPPGLSGAMFDVALRGALLLVVAVVAVRLMRGSSAATRHLVWTAALVALVALPMLRFVLPRVPVAVPLLETSWDAPAPGEAMVVSWPLERVEPVLPAGPTAYAESVPAALAFTESPREEAAYAPDAYVDAGDASSAMAGGGVTSLGDLLVLVWLFGAFAAFAPVTHGLLQLWRFGRRAPAAMDDEVQRLARMVRAELGVRRRVRIIEGPAGAMPLTWGVLRPVVLLPAGAGQWRADRLLAVLRHEYAHIARHDALTQLAGEVATALHWFNPLAWIAAHRQRVEREHACDDLVLSCGPLASDYATSLVDLARELKVARSTRLAALAMARPSGLRDRLEALLDGERSRERLSGRMVWHVAMISALPVFLLACVSPVRGRGMWKAVEWADLAVLAPAAPLASTIPEPGDVPFVEMARPAARATELPPGALRRVMPPPAVWPPSRQPRVSTRIATATSVLARSSMQENDLTARVLRQAARRGMGDHDLAELLLVAIEGGLSSADARLAFGEAAVSIGSDHDRRRVLEALMRSGGAGPVEAAIALRAAESIGSDHDRAELLLAVIEVVAIDDALAVPFMRVLDGIGSKSDHGRVASALLRQRGR